ncbi:unnamed protein product [Nesidiocoris tenuis]|uniref:Uncharacterized protein n=1 Tax=Nesidiocoris tenuis TaxID=355587 RepID=A0A6H5GT73_9HEMI|nr:unnamed protein product [Nesidiocoris tenuis]
MKSVDPVRLGNFAKSSLSFFGEQGRHRQGGEAMSSRVSQCVSSVRLERHALTSSDPLLEGGLARPGQLRSYTFWQKHLLMDRKCSFKRFFFENYQKIQRTDVKSGVSALANTSTSFGSAAAHNVDPADDAVRMQALLEEEAVINHYKSKVQSPTNTGGAPAASATNPFLINSPTQPIVDLFGAPVPSAETQSQPTKALDDLLQLGNPFADMFGAPGAPGAVPGMGQQMPGAPMGGPPQMQAGAPQSNNMWMSNGFGAAAPTQQPVQQSAAFVSDSAFSSVFGPSDPNLAAAQAVDPTVNPFMAMGGGGGDSPAKSLAGGGVAPPPPRPPPPRPASPPKTALDDLNESIRMAMGGGGSPSKQATAPTIPGQMMPGQMAQQPMPNPQYPPGVMPCPQIPPGGQVPAAAAGYYGSSPSKVPMAAMQEACSGIRPKTQPNQVALLIGHLSQWQQRRAPITDQCSLKQCTIFGRLSISMYLLGVGGHDAWCWCRISKAGAARNGPTSTSGARSFRCSLNISRAALTNYSICTQLSFTLVFYYLRSDSRFQDDSNTSIYTVNMEVKISKNLPKIKIHQVIGT